MKPRPSRRSQARVGKRPGAFRALLALGLLAASATVGVITQPASPAAADADEDQLLVTLDISGSMADDDGTGSTKIDSAKKALDGAVDAVPEGAQLGLRTYGGGCTNTNLDVPIGPLNNNSDKDAFKNAIASQQPAGDTPIAHALDKAAGDFSGNGRKTILLVSDGEETCGGDPVAKAKELADKGISLCIDVIGFKVDDATRAQLTDIANAACGKYYEANDGAALSARLHRASVRALRPYTTVGTPVTGSPDGLNPPVLKPGSYVDTMPPNVGEEEPSRWYAVDIPEGATAHFAATVPWTSPLGVTATPDLGVKSYTEDNDWCWSETSYNWSEGGAIAVDASMKQSANDADAKEGDCGAAGRYLFEVHNNGDEVRGSNAPLEIVVVIEPKARHTDDLPGPVKDDDKVAEPKATGKATPVVGSGSYGDAPLLENGNYTDTLRPGEEVYYRVPVDYGQRVASQLKLPRLNSETSEKLGSTTVKFGISSPDRHQVAQSGSDTSSYYGGDPETLTASTSQVRYRNRTSDTTTIANTTLPGYYYVWLYMEPDVTDPYFELPINLEVDVQGEVLGTPDFETTADLPAPGKQLSLELPDGSKAGAEDSDNSDGSNVLALVGIVAGAVLLLGGSTAVGILLNKRRRPIGH